MPYATATAWVARGYRKSVAVYCITVNTIFNLLYAHPTHAVNGINVSKMRGYRDRRVLHLSGLPQLPGVFQLRVNRPPLLHD